jgi:hypothetical protein
MVTLSAEDYACKDQSYDGEAHYHPTMLHRPISIHERENRLQHIQAALSVMWATTLAGWRNIPFTLKTPEKGERKAHACAIARFRHLSWFGVNFQP